MGVLASLDLHLHVRSTYKSGKQIFRFEHGFFVLKSLSIQELKQNPSWFEPERYVSKFSSHRKGQMFT